MKRARLTPCGECGMLCDAREYHPYAACLLFKASKSAETVRENLRAVLAHGINGVIGPRTVTDSGGMTVGPALVFAWFDTFNETFTRDPNQALRAIQGGNGVLALWGDASHVRTLATRPEPA